MTRFIWLSCALLSLAAVACGTATVSPGSSSAGSVAPSAGAIASASAKATTSPSASAAIGVSCDKTPMKFDPAKIDLTGAWLPNDEGIYYIRQLGKITWWNGMSDRAQPAAQLGRSWNNVARGEIKADLTIDVEWSDVPRGEILGHGTMLWKIVDDGTGNVKLIKVSETGDGFGGEEFFPCRPG